MSKNLALVVDQTGATLEVGPHDTLFLIHENGHRERVGLRALGSVVLHGNVKLSTNFLQAMAAHEISLTALSMKGHAPTVGFSRMPSRHIKLRHRQHLAYANATQRLDLARTIILAKLEAMAEFSRYHAPLSEIKFYQAMHATMHENEIAGLMGIEGGATARHFESLAELYERNSAFRFNGRTRQPPRDEPNALMSLSYTLAQGQATQLILHAGLDAQIGFLHALYQNRESLSLDLLEPARSALDAWVNTLLADHGLLKQTMFNRYEDDAVWLTKEGRGLFYPAWFRDGYRIALLPMRKLLASLLTHLRKDIDPSNEQI